MRILVAHPSPVVADGMAATLAEELGADVAAAHTEPQLQQLVAAGVADVTVLDANFAGDAVTRLCHELSASDGRVVVITRPGRETHLELLACGAAGIVAATNGLAGLVLAVRTVTQGHTHVPAHLLGAVLHEVVLARRQEEQPTGDRLGALSPREREVLGLLGAGADTREIAARLVISPHTAKTHINRLLGKLGLASRTEAAAFAISHDVRPEILEVSHD